MGKFREIPFPRNRTCHIESKMRFLKTHCHTSELLGESIYYSGRGRPVGSRGRVQRWLGFLNAFLAKRLRGVGVDFEEPHLRPMF